MAGIKIKRGVIYSADALIALSIIILTLLLAYPIYTFSKQESKLYSDILPVLSNLKIGEMNNSYIETLKLEGKIADLNKSILEQIGEFYSTNITLARELAQEAISSIDSRENIGIWYDSDLIASVNSTPFEQAGNSRVERQVISGIFKGERSTGFIAKAWLKKISKKQTSLVVKGDAICGRWKTYFWGDYCGNTENTIYYSLNIPLNATNITNALWLVEGSWVNQYNQLYVNGNKIFDGTINYYQSFNITPYIQAGNNTLTLYSNGGGDDGASHAIVDYNIPDMQTYSHQKVSLFNVVQTNSVLHYEKSIFMATAPSSINVSINTSKDTTLYIRKSNQTIIIGKKLPVDNKVIFTDSEIKNNLSLKGISYSSLNNEYSFFIIEIGKDQPGTPITLGANSYVYIDSPAIEMTYGTIDITQKIPIILASNRFQYTFYRYLVWQFNLPLNSIPILTDWQFGWLSSEGIPTQKATANSIVLYNSPPDPAFLSFSRFGYTPSKAGGAFKEGINNFTLEFGSNYGVSNGSSSGFVTYFIKNYVNYGRAFPKAQGGIKIAYFEDSSSKTFEIGNINDPWDPKNDSVDDAVERLLSQLDSDNNSRIDLFLDTDNFEIDNIDISGVPYLWSTEVQVRKWY